MSDEPFTISLTRPAETAAFVPYLMGFHPTNSLVTLGLHGRHVICSARADLPTEAAHGGDFLTACDTLAHLLAQRGASSAVLLGYGVLPLVRHGVTIAEIAFARRGLPIDDVLHVHEEHARSLRCTDPACCPPGGTPVASSGAAVASAVYAGLTALPDRAALARQLEPVTGEQRAAFTLATAVAGRILLEQFDAADAADPGGDLWATPAGTAMIERAGVLIDEGLQLYRAGRILDDDRAALLSVLVAFPPITQVALRRSGEEPWQTAMWMDLLRRCGPPFAAGCGVVLAFSALQAGNGALARLAVERSLHADPQHWLAGKLQQLIHAGVDPDTAARIAHT